MKQSAEAMITSCKMTPALRIATICVILIGICSELLGANICELYPIALSTKMLKCAKPGDILPDILNGTQPGNFGWLSWTGDQDANTLAASLTPPGNSYMYINPSNSSDHSVDVGDWVIGLSGVNNSTSVRRALDALVTREFIIVPVWDQAKSQGANTQYRIAAFAKVKLLSYRLVGEDKITAKFLGYVSCEPTNVPPIAFSFSVTGYVNTPLEITLLGSDPDNHPLTYQIVSGPNNGQLVGSPPNLTYIPNPQYLGTDSFTYRVNDSQLSSPTATVDITILPLPLGVQVDAEPDQVINLPAEAILTGTIKVSTNASGGQPTIYSVVWSLVDGPAPVTFSNPTNLVTSVSFSAPGIYTFKLTVNTGTTEESDETIVIANTPPIVHVCPPSTNYVNDPVRVFGFVTDDGLPPNTGVELRWEVISGPGSATILNPDETNTIAYFPSPGEYSIRLTANDEASESFAETSIVILPKPNSNVCDLYYIPLKGYASLYGQTNYYHDIVFVIDTSGSTRRLTGFDLNNDGRPDTIFEAEIEACRRLIQLLTNSSRIRIGIVKFARYYTSNAPLGGISDGPPIPRQTRLVQDLTTDFESVFRALDVVASEGAVGGTHTAKGIDIAVMALTNAPPPGTNRKVQPNKHIVLLTDGIPTLPIESGYTQERGDRLATLEAAQRAANLGIKIHPIVIDPEDQAERRLTTMPAVKAITGVPGEIIRVNTNNIGELPSLLSSLKFTGVKCVQVLELGTGRLWEINVQPDGWFEAYIPVYNIGTNTWEIRFLSGDLTSDQIAFRRVSFVVYPSLQWGEIIPYIESLPPVSNLDTLYDPTGNPLSHGSLLSIIKSNFPNARVVPSEAYWGNSNIIRIRIVYRGSTNNSDVGYFLYDPENPPTSSEQVIATLDETNVLFNTSIGQATLVKEISVEPGKYIGFFILPNKTLQEIRGTPSPVALFTVSHLNSGGFGQFISFCDGLRVVLAVEEDPLIVTSNRDFTDIVFSIDPILPAPQKLTCKSKP